MTATLCQTLNPKPQTNARNPKPLAPNPQKTRPQRYTLKQYQIEGELIVRAGVGQWDPEAVAWSSLSPTQGVHVRREGHIQDGQRVLCRDNMLAPTMVLIKGLCRL